MSVEEILHARMADAHKDQQQWNVDPTAHGIYAEPQQIPAEQKESKAAAGFFLLNLRAMVKCSWYLLVSWTPA